MCQLHRSEVLTLRWERALGCGLLLLPENNRLGTCAVHCNDCSSPCRAGAALRHVGMSIPEKGCCSIKRRINIVRRFKKSEEYHRPGGRKHISSFQEQMLPYIPTDSSTSSSCTGLCCPMPATTLLNQGNLPHHRKIAFCDRFLGSPPKYCFCHETCQIF